MNTLAHPRDWWLVKGATLLLIPLALLLLCVAVVSAFPAEVTFLLPADRFPTNATASAPTTDVCGNVNTPTTWTLVNSPYVATCDIYVSAGVTLTIEPGVVIKFQHPDRQLHVDGVLVARGATGQAIIFTSFKDDSVGGDTNGDGLATTPAPGDWNELRFNSQSVGILDHVEVRYGGKSYGHAVYVMTPKFSVADSTFANAREEGIYFEGAMAPLLLRNNFVGNGGAADHAWRPVIQVGRQPSRRQQH